VQKDPAVTTSKKVVLNRKEFVPTPTTATPSVLSTADQTTDKDSNNSNDAEKKEEKKVVKLTELSAQERAKLHAQKFGLPVSDSSKKLARAERFGMADGAANNSNSTKTTTNPKEVDEKILKRQARFGVVAPSAAATEVEAKKQKRAERFGITTPIVANAAVDEQKRKRAERFGLAA
jgi:SAP domain-containing ribonucleoprotein